jgi:hypothetical protein
MANHFANANNDSRVFMSRTQEKRSGDKEIRRRAEPFAKFDVLGAGWLLPV